MKVIMDDFDYKGWHFDHFEINMRDLDVECQEREIIQEIIDALDYYLESE